MKSILQREKRCYRCGSYQWLEEHHIYEGNPNRKISEKNGFKVFLCHWCHNEPPNGVHFNREFALELKAECQAKYESMGHTREEFICLIGRNYL